MTETSSENVLRSTTIMLLLLGCSVSEWVGMIECTIHKQG